MQWTHKGAQYEVERSTTVDGHGLFYVYVHINELFSGTTSLECIFWCTGGILLSVLECQSCEYATDADQRCGSNHMHCRGMPSLGLTGFTICSIINT